MPRRRWPPLSSSDAKARSMKVGVVTDDGKTISPHFGVAKNYVVFDIEDGKVKAKETRPKAWHEHGAGEHPDREGGEHHGGVGTHRGASEHSTHGEMLSNVRDCEALVARGMGRPMYEAILGAGIKPYITELPLAEEAALAYAKGTLDNQTRKLH